jgi:A/G-specific adenine glycosylase
MQHHKGVVPSEVTALLTLPGIGRYSAGAIASIAFGQPAPIVDGNVIRLLCRFFGLTGDPARAPLKNQLWQLAAQLIPPKKARDFNQALMEMGAICCTPKLPLCGQCPLASRCQAHLTQATDRLPELAGRAKITKERHVALLAEKSGSYLLEQRSTDAPRWAGLWQFPNTKVAPRQAARDAVLSLANAAKLQVDVPTPLVSLTHSITRYRIALDAFHCKVQRSSRHGSRSGTVRWIHPDDLARYALPSPHAKIARALREINDRADT